VPHMSSNIIDPPPTKDRVLSRIQEIKTEFYETNKKNVFFKKTQKQELANRIIQELSIGELIDASVYVFSPPNTQTRIYVDYSVIKMYIHANIYEQILEKLISILTSTCKNTADGSDQTYEMHINLEGFTITSAERHKVIIEQFCQRMNNTHYFDYMQIMYIYNTPTMIDTISSFFSYLLHPDIKKKMVKYDKAESDVKMAQLFTA
jgi:hypothetical protein